MGQIVEWFIVFSFQIILKKIIRQVRISVVKRIQEWTLYDLFFDFLIKIRSEVKLMGYRNIKSIFITIAVKFPELLTFLVQVFLCKRESKG